MRLPTLVAAVLLISGGRAMADGPADNLPGAVRQIPPPGIEVSAADRARLESGLDELAARIVGLRRSAAASTKELLPDVEIFHRAVDQALRFNEMFADGDIRKADELLAEGLKRADHLAQDDAYWTSQKGLVVRGFRSLLDNTVQPYGLVIPDTYRSDIPYRYRTDIWFHGRGERSVELQFIHQRMRDPGQYQPEDTIVLHPFGRYSNAFKFAGEVDVFEALDHAKSNYRVDDERISVRGFSMGGAAAWHFAVHHADRWFAANPGAGFSETPLFLQTFQGEVLQPTWWEKTLWQWYDCPGWVLNLNRLPTIAYSGELDVQKQSADVMSNAFDRFQLATLQHVIGAGTGHQIHAQSKSKISQCLEQVRNHVTKAPLRVDFTTNSLKYNRMHWLTVNSLDQHWSDSLVSVDISRILTMSTIRVSPFGVNDLTLSIPAGTFDNSNRMLPIDVQDPTRRIDETDLDLGLNISPVVGEPPAIQSDGSWTCRLYRQDNSWHIGTPPWENELRKRHGLQGPIDDALMDSFVFVKPGGECRHPLVEEWTTAELDHATTHWRQQMRGDVRIKADVEITDEDIARHNLILWGDPASNSVLQRIADQLPIRWGENEIIVGEQRFDAAHHAPILIYPNPLNPRKYVVLNSSFTYREYDYLNNARQTPKLPDWAVVDLRVKPDTRWPGKIVDADFFDERWQLQQPYRERIAPSGN